MAYHKPYYLMTAQEASERYRYMKPHAVYCGEKRIEQSGWADYILEDIEVSHGIVHYFTHRATPEELAAIPAARAEYEKREQERRAEKERALIASGDAYRCPHCGEIHRLKEYEKLASTPGVYFCPDCLDDVTLDTLEQIAPEEAQEEAAPEMVNTRDLLDDLDTGDYGGNLNDYRDSSAYICDAISEIADNNTSIYWYDIKRFIADHVDAVEEALDEFGWDGCGRDLMKAGQMAECITIERDIYDHLADSLLAAAVDFIRYDLEREQIPAELAELLREWADEADNDDRMSDIPDKIRAYFEAKNDEQEAI